MMRLPDKMPKKMKVARVEEIIEILELQKCRNTMIGDFLIPGLSGGEKKRANIACEMLTDPHLLLMDEPTTGLDYALAYNLMMNLKRYTMSAGKTSVITIHQPSSQIFHMFDNVLLLSSGRVAYFGESSMILEHFSNVGLHAQPRYNPADFIIESIKRTEENEEKLIAYAAHSRETSHFYARIQQETSKHLSGSIDNPAALEELHTRSALCNGLLAQQSSVKDSFEWDSYFDPGARWQTGFWTQFKTLIMRSFELNRNSMYPKVKLFVALAMTVFISVAWAQQPNTESSINSKMSFIFINAVYWGLQAGTEGATSSGSQQQVLVKERVSGLFRLSAYYLARIVSDIPMLVALPLFFTCVGYWVVGLTASVTNFILYLLFIMLTVTSAHSLGALIGVIITDTKTALPIASLSMLCSMFAGGFYLRPIPGYLVWLPYLSLFHYGFSGLMAVEYGLGNPSVRCMPMNQTIFPECASNMTISVPGYRVLESQYVTQPLWVSVVGFLIYQAVFRLAAYLVLRFVHKPKGPAQHIRSRKQSPSSRRKAGTGKSEPGLGVTNNQAELLNGRTNKALDLSEESRHDEHSVKTPEDVKICIDFSSCNTGFEVIKL